MEQVKGFSKEQRAALDSEQDAANARTEARQTTINGAGHTVVPVPNSIPTPTAAPKRVSFQDLLCALVVDLVGGPKEFKPAEGKLASLGFYGNGKVTLDGITFQVQVSAQVVKSKDLQPGVERDEVKRKLGLLAI